MLDMVYNDLIRTRRHHTGRVRDTGTAYQLGSYDAAAFDHDQNALFFSAFFAVQDSPFLLAGLAPEELFVNLNDTAHCGEVLMAHVHHFADRMAKLPGRLL